MALQKLSKDTVQLISSSQVITSVHSVVKELVENSLDAKSTNIEVKLENYGLDLIQVRDNGTGIKKTDVPLMASPHFTSKLASFQDLSSLCSYGFRGEALSSIANIADLGITTATKEDEIAYTYTIGHSGDVVSSQPSSLGAGTTITVHNLFKNVPVRKKAYKSPKRCKEDLKKVELVLMAFGLAHPNDRFTLKHNKIKIWEKEQAYDFKSNLALIFGPIASQSMMSVNYQCFKPMVKLQVHVPKPAADLTVTTRSKPDRMFILVNQRSVEIKEISKLVRDSFMEAFPNQAGRYPVAVITISVLPEDIDVNLEPNKTAVLLHNIEFITTTLSSVLTQAYGPCKIANLGPQRLEKEPSQSHLPQTAEQPSPSPTDCGQVTCLATEGQPPNSDSSTTLIESSHNETQTQRNPQNPVAEQPQSSRDVLTTDENAHFGREILSTNRDLFNGGVPLSNCGESAQGDVCALEQEYDFRNYSLLEISELEKDFSSSDEETMKEQSEELNKNHGGVVLKPITQHVSLLSWSRGEAITDAAQRIVEPVKVLCPSTFGQIERGSSKTASQSKLTFARPSPVFDMIDSHPMKRTLDKSSPNCEDRPNKRHRPSTPSLDSLPHEQQQLHTSVGLSASETSEEQEVPSMRVSFDLDGISKRNESLWQINLPRATRANCVIGSCRASSTDSNIWIVLLHNSIARFNIHRVLGSSSNTLLAHSKKDVELIFTDVLKNTNTCKKETQTHFHEIYPLNK